MWVRGLKLSAGGAAAQADNVAPYVGAWIETEEVNSSRPERESHPMWVRGLKQTRYIMVRA